MKRIHINYTIEVIDNAVLVKGNIGENQNNVNMSLSDTKAALAFVEAKTSKICSAILDDVSEKENN